MCTWTAHKPGKGETSTCKYKCTYTNKLTWTWIDWFDEFRTTDGKWLQLRTWKLNRTRDQTMNINWIDARRGGNRTVGTVTGKTWRHQFCLIQTSCNIWWGKQICFGKFVSKVRIKLKPTARIKIKHMCNVLNVAVCSCPSTHPHEKCHDDCYGHFNIG